MANIQHIPQQLHQKTRQALLILAISWAGIILVPFSSQAQTDPQESAEFAETVTPVPRITRPTLRPDSQGESVVELQALLRLLGFYSGPMTGIYAEPTQAAVEQFQSAAGLTADGIVGPATWSRLLPAPADEVIPPTAQTVDNPEPAPRDPASSPSEASASPPTSQTPAAEPASERPLLRLGAEGEAVSRLQRQLQTLGFYQGTVDGIFGPRTEQAVKAAQESYNITPDGVVGPATWSALGS